MMKIGELPHCINPILPFQSRVLSLKEPIAVQKGALGMFLKLGGVRPPPCVLASVHALDTLHDVGLPGTMCCDGSTVDLPHGGQEPEVSVSF